MPQSNSIELKFTFKDGGAPDFHSNFERIKERLQQAMEVARESNAAGSGQAGGLGGVNMEAVHLDELPSYENSGNDRVAPPPSETRGVQGGNIMDEPVPTSTMEADRVPDNVSIQPTLEPPSDAPPGYEETQQQSVQNELERRLGENPWS